MPQRGQHGLVQDGRGDDGHAGVDDGGDKFAQHRGPHGVHGIAVHKGLINKGLEHVQRHIGQRAAHRRHDGADKALIAGIPAPQHARAHPGHHELADEGDQDVDYIVLAPVTETGWDAVLGEAKQAGIPVIIVDRMVDVKDDSLYTAWVGSNFELEGKKAAAYLDAYMKAKNMKDMKLVNIQGTIGASAQIGRTKGLDDAVAANGWNLLDKTTGEFTQAKGQEVMQSFLKKYKKDINVVYCENDNEAFGAIDAIKAAGYEVGADKDMMVFSFDSTKEGLKKVQSGEITLNTECNPLHGPRVEAIIKQLENKETPEKKAYVDEEMFAHDDTVKSVTVDGKEYPVTVVTDEVMGARKY